MYNYIFIFIVMPHLSTWRIVANVFAILESSYVPNMIQQRGPRKEEQKFKVKFLKNGIYTKTGIFII